MDYKYWWFAQKMLVGHPKWISQIIKNILIKCHLIIQQEKKLLQNYKRPGLLQIIDYGIKGELKELVICYKDRLVRFGYELIEYILKKYSFTNIIILNDKKKLSPMQEITEDILTIMNIFVARINGLRKYKKMLEDDIK